MKDSQQKDALFKHHWVQRHFAQPEVEIYLPGGAGDQAKMITDVDVLAIRPSPELSFDRMLGDCKTLKNVSAIGRALWLSGLMRFLYARAGTVILKVESIEQDHRQAAARVGVSLFSEADFAIYDKAINYPTGSEESAVSAQDVRDLYAANSKYGLLTDLLQYLKRDAWQDPNLRNLAKRTLGQVRTFSTELDPAKQEHLALVTDAAAVFSIGLAEIVGRIFHSFLQPSDKVALSELLLNLVWGGREVVQLVKDLRRQVMGSDGASVPADPELPEWNGLVQLVRNLLEQPPASFEVPWLLRHLAIDLFRGRQPLPSASQRDLYSLKHAMMVAGHFCKACDLPREFGQKIVGELVRLQSSLVSPATTSQAADQKPTETS